MSLRRYAIRVVETRGLLHQVTLRALRLYIKTHTDEELIKEIKDMETAPQLRALWEAGLNARLQEAVLGRLEKMK